MITHIVQNKILIDSFCSSRIKLTADDLSTKDKKNRPIEFVLKPSVIFVITIIFSFNTRMV